MRIILIALLLFDLSTASGDVVGGEDEAALRAREQASQNRPKTVIVRENIETGEIEYLSIKQAIKKDDEAISQYIKSLPPEFRTVSAIQVVKSIDDLDGREDISDIHFFFYDRPYSYYYPHYYDEAHDYNYTYTPYYNGYFDGYGYRFFW